MQQGVFQVGDNNIGLYIIRARLFINSMLYLIRLTQAHLELKCRRIAQGHCYKFPKYTGIEVRLL